MRISLLIAGLLSVLVLLYYFSKVRQTEYGINFLQVSGYPLDSVKTLESLKKLKAAGFNSIALIPFFKQESVSSNDMQPAGHITHNGLRQAIVWARELGLAVTLKPQFLVDGSWAGAIKANDWSVWFDHYTRHLLSLAELAENHHIKRFVIGTELKLAAKQPQWKPLISKIRQVYSGELSYVAHNVDGLENFSWWHLLDSAGITLYPSLSHQGSFMRYQITQKLLSVRRVADKLKLPVWIAEFGIASRRHAHRRPWAWHDLADKEKQVDLEIQKRVLSNWVHAFRRIPFDSIFLWNWLSNPDAGGYDNNDYTIQNKPAEKLLRCQWIQLCE